MPKLNDKSYLRIGLEVVLEPGSIKDDHLGYYILAIHSATKSSLLKDEIDISFALINIHKESKSREEFNKVVQRILDNYILM